MNPTHRSALLSALGLPLLFLLASGCTANGEAASDTESTSTTPRQRVVRVETQVLQPANFEDVVQITGTIEAPDDATLSAQTGGTLEWVASLGARVDKGDVVARLDDDLLTAGLRQAEALLNVQKAQEDLATDNFSRQQALFRDSIISALEFETVRTQMIQAQAQRNQAESAVAQAAKQVQNALVTAPFAGTVEEHFADIGEQMAPGTQVVRLVNTGRVLIVAGVPERYASDIRPGTAVTATFGPYGLRPVTGTVRFASGVIDPSSRTFRVEVEVANPDRSLKPSMIANIQVTRQRMENQLVVPVTSVIRDETSTTVFVVTTTGDGTQQIAERRTVTLGANNAGRVVIESGLSAGDEVIVTGQTNVTEGDAVEIAKRSTTN